MDRDTHGSLRSGMLTSTCAKIIMSGNYDRWNTLAEALRNPKPFHGITENSPAPLKWGVEHEPMACAMFWDRHPEFEMDDVKYMPFHDPENALFWYVGDSPDRLILKDGLLHAALEAKAPFNQAVHEEYLGMGYIPEEHLDQCYWHCFVNNVDRCYFVSIDPRRSEPVDYVERLVVVDPERMMKLEELTRRFVEGFVREEEFKRQPRTLADFKTL